jgi:ribonuclease P protein subunit RPR2
MPRKKKSDKKLIKKIALTRMNYLFNRAHEIFPENKDLANRYIYLTRRYAQRAKIRIPKEWKKRICNKCKLYLYPGINCRVRMHSKGKGSHISVTCLECNKVTRYFYKLKND